MITRLALHRWIRARSNAPYTGSGPRVVIVKGEDFSPALGRELTKRNTSVLVLRVGSEWVKREVMKELNAFLDD